LTGGLALLGGPFLLVFLDRFVPLVAVILVLILLSRGMELLQLLHRVRVAFKHLSLSVVVRLVGRNRIIFSQRRATESIAAVGVTSAGFLAQTGVAGDTLITSNFLLFLCSSDLKSIVEKTGVHLVGVIVLSANVRHATERELGRRHVLQSALGIKDLVEFSAATNL
jgi:hypothetical protein